MTLAQFVGQSLKHYWKTNLAILLGVVVGTAVIGGALIVGDSVRASLRQMTIDRLGAIDDLVSGHRFFREQLADDLLSGWSDGSPPRIAPALVLIGSVERVAAEATRRAGQVNVYGVDQRAWELIDTATAGAPAANAETNGTAPTGTGVFLNQSLAASLNAAEGDEITLWLELPSAVPRDTLLGKKDNDASEVTLQVARILPDQPGAARLGLLPTQQLPRNLFVNLRELQTALDLEEVRPTRRDPIGQVARVNTLFAAAPVDDIRPPSAADRTRHTALTDALSRTWTLADLNLRIVHDTTLNVLSVESEQMLLEDRFAEVVLKYAAERNLPASPVMVYLANWLRNPNDPKAYSMYSTVAGLDLLDLDDAFGPFEFVGTMPDALGDDDIIINQFLAEDLKVQVGDEVRFAYHVVGSHGELPEIERVVTVKGIVAMTGAAADQQLTPTVKGITDADSLDDWEQPFSMDLDAVTPRDDDYWTEYRATPKAYFRLDTAQRLWPNRYGSYTSVRVALKPGQTFEDGRDELSRALLAALTPDDVGLAFQPVRALGLQAAGGATDFTGLFIGFSLFLILAAVILVGLLFRLAVEQRVQQLGLLAAIGFAPARVQRLMLQEGFFLVLLGGVLGGAAAIGYAALMLYGLKTWWIGAIGTKFLLLDVQPLSVLTGALAAVLTSLLAVWWGLRRLQQVSIREQLSGISEPVSADSARTRKSTKRRAIVSLTTAVLLVVGVVSGVIPASEAFSGLGWPVVVFFLAGMLCLAAGLWGLSAWLQGDHSAAVRGAGLLGSSRLGLRNAARRRQRSVLTVGLIASASFVIAAVAAGHKNPTAERPEKFSGNGGFTLVAESSSPILYDLNTEDGRRTLNIRPKTPAQSAALAAMHVIAFRVRPGEDASCLNLFQTRVPTLLGAPAAMIERGGFKFIGGGAEPWAVLNQTEADGSVPVLGDMNTLMFGLKKSPGQTLPVTTSAAAEQQLRIAGMFDGAVFQGVLVMSEQNFLRLFPERKGYQYFLIDVPLEHAAAAAELLETELAEYGFDTEPVAERLARFLAVQNTYLSTFQSLGGLGLLLGTLGLATVMLRNVLERQAELALLRAVGFRASQIAALVLAETGFLLGWGLLTGTLAALLSMTPHLLSTGADAPWSTGALLLASVAGVGLLSAAGAVRAATQVPIVSTLRGE